MVGCCRRNHIFGDENVWFGHRIEYTRKRYQRVRVRPSTASCWRALVLHQWLPGAMSWLYPLPGSPKPYGSPFHPVGLSESKESRIVGTNLRGYRFGPPGVVLASILGSWDCSPSKQTPTEATARRRRPAPRRLLSVCFDGRWPKQPAHQGENQHQTLPNTWTQQALPLPIMQGMTEAAGQR